MAIVNPRRPGGGAQAELVVVPAASVARVPEGTSLEAAATLPMNGLTVRLALDAAHPLARSDLGVTGAAGAVGSYAVELGVRRRAARDCRGGVGGRGAGEGFWGGRTVVPRGEGSGPRPA